MLRSTAVAAAVIALQAMTVASVQTRRAAESPRSKLEREWWKQRFEDKAQRVRQGNVDLLFIGDSITQRWEEAGAAIFDEYYGHRNAVNLGFNADRTEHVLWRLQNGELRGLDPKVAVVMIGTNNVSRDPPEDIAAGVRAVVNTLRGLLPETEILLLAIFPRRATSDDRLRRINDDANALIAELDDGERIHFLDIGAVFLDADGKLSERVMPDLLHLSERGYELWAEAMEPTLARLLGDSPVAKD